MSGQGTFRRAAPRTGISTAGLEDDCFAPPRTTILSTDSIAARTFSSLAGMPEFLCRGRNSDSWSS